VRPLRLLCVLAHPDDETLGCGGLLARSAAEGVETYLITATRGERGRLGNERPGPEVVGPVRERELRAAADVLGLREVTVLGYPDGGLAEVDPREAVPRLAAEIRRLRPHVVVTFGADGAYGHPDHVAVSQLTGAALVAAAGPSGDGEANAPHQVDKLYWIAWDAASFDRYEGALGHTLTARVDGVERHAAPWPAWAVTTRVDARAHWRTVWEAVRCHASQLDGYGGLASVGEDEHREVWGGTQSYYRVWSAVNGGRVREGDLFAGLRPADGETGDDGRATMPRTS